MLRALASKKIVAATGLIGVTSYLYFNENDSKEIASALATSRLSAEALAKTVENNSWLPPSRLEMIQKLKGLSSDGKKLADEDQEFDLLIIGGGATGAGCALDAATRGLKTALVERDDFASGIFLLIQEHHLEVLN